MSCDVCSEQSRTRIRVADSPPQSDLLRGDNERFLVAQINLINREGRRIKEQVYDGDPPVVTRRPEFSFPFLVMIPSDHLVGGQSSINGALVAETEALESAEVKSQGGFFNFDRIVTMGHDLLLKVCTRPAPKSLSLGGGVFS